MRTAQPTPMQLVPWLTAATLALPLIACTPQSVPPAPTNPPPKASHEPTSPNAIVLISIDTLRADHTGPGGYDLPTTPFLDKIAKRGITFTQGYATSSFTPTSMASIMTGLYPSSHGVEHGYFDSKRNVAVQDKLADSFTTLAEAIQSKGYSTIGVPSNRHLAADLGFGQGFDHYYAQAGFSTATALTRRAKRMIDDAFGPSATKPLQRPPAFYWIHYFDPHDPYLLRNSWPKTPKVWPNPELAKTLGGKTYLGLKAYFSDPDPDPQAIQTLETLYDGDIYATDLSAQHFWDTYNFDEDTLVIITSDHGEEFFEHGQLGHAKALYQESVHVPFIISWPAAFPTGVTIDTPVSIVDIYPTILDILDIPVDPSIQGESLKPLITGEKTTLKRPILFELTRKNLKGFAFLDGDLKHIEFHEPSPFKVSFDLKSDPLERKNLFNEGSPTSNKAFEKLQQYINALPDPPSDSKEASISDPEELEALKAMGYIE